MAGLIAAKMLADKLKKIRKDRKLTQAELANGAGVSRKVVQSIEAGGSSPTLDSLEALAKFLKLKISDLIQ